MINIFRKCVFYVYQGLKRCLEPPFQHIQAVSHGYILVLLLVILYGMLRPRSSYPFSFQPSWLPPPSTRLWRKYRSHTPNARATQWIDIPRFNILALLLIWIATTQWIVEATKVTEEASFHIVYVGKAREIKTSISYPEIEPP